MAQGCLITLICKLCVGLGCIFASTSQGNMCVSNRSEVTNEATLIIDDKEGLIFCPTTAAPTTPLPTLEKGFDETNWFSVIKNYGEIIVWLILVVIALTGGKLGKNALKKLKKKLDRNHAHVSTLLQSLIDSSHSSNSTTSTDAQTEWSGDWESHTPFLQTPSSHQSTTNPFFSFSSFNPQISTTIDNNEAISSSQNILQSSTTQNYNSIKTNGNETPTLNNLISLNDTLEMFENSITRPSHSNASFTIPEVHSFSNFNPEFCSSKNEPPPIPPRDHPVRDRKQTQFYQAQ